MDYRNAETWYENGIEASMQFYGLDPSLTSFTAYFLQPANGLGDYTGYPFTFNFTTYYNQAAVKYAGGAAGLNQILLQKYLASFQNSGWEAYFNWAAPTCLHFKVVLVLAIMEQYLYCQHIQ
jgi:hypothetical protein